MGRGGALACSGQGRPPVAAGPQSMRDQTTRSQQQCPPHRQHPPHCSCPAQGVCQPPAPEACRPGCPLARTK
eukprot:scaffold746_cov112-Isochrysis_galbana.AAC.4